MGRLEVQGIVSVEKGLPFVQCRQLDDQGDLMAGWQITPQEAREMAQQLVEASMNAIYDAALVSWAKESGMPEDLSMQMLVMIRTFRADTWGLPDQPDDWRNNG